MTREEIEKMEAEIELDALIAEKVMGIKPLSISYVERYSTDIAAAWSVMEKMRERDACWCPNIFWDDMDGLADGEWSCAMTYYSDLPEEFRQYEALGGNNPSLAICRAALLAVCDDTP
jgi:hypothetical protein